MSGTIVMRRLLTAWAPLTALVPAANIVAGDVEQNTVLPAVSITKISGYEFASVARLQRQSLITERIQVTVYAKTFPDMEALMTAAKLGPGIFHGMVGPVKVISVERDVVGPDISLADPRIFIQSRDFIVKYVEAN